MSRQSIIFKCVECKFICYLSSKNTKNTIEKLELKKYCKKCQKTILHKETKIKK